MSICDVRKLLVNSHFTESRCSIAFHQINVITWSLNNRFTPPLTEISHSPVILPGYITIRLLPHCNIFFQCLQERRSLWFVTGSFGYYTTLINILPEKLKSNAVLGRCCCLSWPVTANNNNNDNVFVSLFALDSAHASSESGA